MGKNSVAAFLAGLLFVSGLFTAWYAFFYWKNIRELRQVQAQANVLNHNQNVFKMLLNETIEYSRRNPAIDPILQSVGAKPGAAKPASKAQ